MASTIRTLTLPMYNQGIIFRPDSSPHQSVFETSATQKHRLGARFCDGDRTFRYAKAGAAGGCLKAKMTESQVIDTKTHNIAQTGHAWAVGDVSGTMLITTGGTWATNEFTDGYFFSNDEAADGDIYRVLASQITSTVTILQLELETPIRTAIPVTTEMSLVPNRFYDVVISPTTTSTGYSTGVPLVDVPNGYYFWAQTAGPCPMVVDQGATDGNVIVIGNTVGVGANDAGTCMNRVTLEHSFGNVLIVGAATEVALINLSIDQ